MRPLAVAATVLVLAGCGGSKVSQANPDKLATEINAAWCQDSGYYLISDAGSKAELYDCNMKNGSYKCVTEQNGIANDVTAEAKLSFASTLGSDKPDCVKDG